MLTFEALHHHCLAPRPARGLSPHNALDRVGGAGSAPCSPFRGARSDLHTPWCGSLAFHQRGLFSSAPERRASLSPLDS